MAYKKVLLLGTHDSKLAGHVYSAYTAVSQHVDAVLITRLGLYGKEDYCYWPINGSGLSFLKKIRRIRFSRFFFFLWKYVYSFFRYGCIPVIDKKHSEYNFIDFQFVPYSAKDILKKCPDGFVPELIVICWSSRFISAKMIHDLYQLTKASFVYCFVDEAPMTGGCHYPNECKGYLDGCQNCPALRHGKKLAAIQLKFKKKYLRDVRMYISGSPYDIRLAQKTDLFKDSIPIPGINCPKVDISSRGEARSKLGISNNKFVILLGANHLDDVRKGFTYSAEAINIIRSEISNLLVIAVGNTCESFKHNFPKTEVLELGFVDTEKMVLAFCAADCFLSTTIADSGPQMVNYSIATGTPVVSFSIGIAEDLVLHKRTGYVAQFKNVNDVANGLRFLYSLDEDSQQRMSEECIRLIKERASKGGWKEQLLGIPVDI